MVKKRAESRAGMIVTTIAMEPDLHRRLAVASLEENAAITEIIRQAAREWLDRREQKRKRRANR
jgi:hypothetical protein